MNELNQLLHEAFHTYRIYLDCSQWHETPLKKNPVSLLKWPDVAQSAIAWGQALASGQITNASSAKLVLENDLTIAIVSPVEAVYKSIIKRIEEVTGNIPPSKIEPKTHPILYKNEIIKHINDMLTTLETLSGVKYPKIRRLDGSFNR